MNRGHRFYTNPSLWDTYRNKLVMMEIFQPEVTADIIKSLIVRGEEKGFIPTFFTEIMLLPLSLDPICEALKILMWIKHMNFC